MSERRIIKALSLHEPWASMIAEGEKTIETRMWRTSFRGILAICATKIPVAPRSGQVVALCRLVDCRPMTIEDEAAACCTANPGRYAWVLRDVRPIEPGICVCGAQGLFDVELHERLVPVLESIVAKFMTTAT